jgi:carbon starvation protein
MQAMHKLLRLLLWIAVSLGGVAAILVPALRRGEQVNALWLVVAGVCAFAVSYRFYSAWLAAKVLAFDDRRATPAVTRADGKDYVPTNKWVVFGHHFAAIAGPGPLVGPVLAAQFGWLPGTLWILIGATLGGGVHDAVIMFCSTRRDGKSLGRMLREEINPVLGFVAMISVLVIMTILLAVLGLVVVQALAESPWGLFTIAMTIPIALVMGLWHRGGGSVRAVTIFGVAALLFSVWGGKYLGAWGLENGFRQTQTWLAWAIIIYGFVAAVLPVWLLLAPRDYLSTFMKIGTVAVLAVAIVLVAPVMEMPALTKFTDGSGPVFAGAVFPFVFITIACGAISGFHALISSGTTPKLLEREKHIRAVGYGAMVTEMLVALMAIIAACSLKPGEYFAVNAGAAKAVATVSDPAARAAKAETVLAQLSADTGFAVTPAQMQKLADDVGEENMIGRAGGAPTFALGMAQMFHRVFPGEGLMALWYHFAIMFEALFILTTIDAGTRVGRFILQDFLGNLWKPLGDTRHTGSSFAATALLVGAWGWFLLQGVADPLGGINSLWPLFGIANQLLAVIALCLGTTVLIKMGRKRYAWTTALPLVWLTAVTFTAGIQKIFGTWPAARFGFLDIAKDRVKKLDAGGTADQVKLWKTEIFNNYLDAAVAGFFLIMVAIILTGSIREWINLLTGRKKAVLRESPYVPLPEGAA